MTGEVTLLGVRHHGPGSARAVAAALDALRPDAVLVEGPPEGDPLVALAGSAEMVPPVALLVHAADDPARAAFWPFAAFSPEWVAIRHGLAAGVPVRFIDLPAGAGFALDAEDAVDGEPAGEPADPIAVLAAAAGRADSEAWWEDVVEHRVPEADPLATFAAVGEAVAAVRRDDPVGTPGSPGVAPGRPAGRRERLREAHMRRQLRAARRAGHRRIAVVCGAWHVPALAAVDAPGAARVDRELLAGLPRKVRTAAAWVPWTEPRLAQRSGYGAGVESPAWYRHLFDSAPGEAVPGWLARAAGLLRAADHPVPPALVIEAVRTAEALAALRGRPVPGLAETLDAVRGVYCEGSEVALALVRERLVVGDAVGRVPAAAPAVPLQRDLDRLQRRLRLAPRAEQRELDLDLRRELDAGRSRLLHRLRLLGVAWGQPAGRAGTGTFRERWQLRWEPDFAVRVVAAAPWGTTVEGAATARAAALAAQAPQLAELTALAEQCLAADLTGALPAVLRALGDRAALDTDAAHLADALPALVRALRYGDVRGTDRTALAGVAHTLADRLRLGLPAACTGLSPEQAPPMRARLDAAHTAIGLLARMGEGESEAARRIGAVDHGVSGAGVPREVVAAAEGGPDPAAGLRAVRGADAPSGTEGPGSVVPGPAAVVRDDGLSGADSPADGSVPRTTAPGIAERWAVALDALARGDGVPGEVRGRAVRLLLDDGRIGAADTGLRLRVALSRAAAPADAAGWVTGFLAGGGALLLHDPRLLALLDEWLTGLPEQEFTDLLPLLRRAFAELEPGVRQGIGDRIAEGPATPAALPPRPLDRARADAAVPTVLRLLGRPAPAPPPRPRIPRQTDRRSAA
ncbi:DUF5682 family protein [Kitasatospora sp. NPDC006697]|uniref:DUF5682 family protein n=1 Tax=Kitasatospora sp. NPDC006697 TaxID=3364020 RepID=UPI003697EE73